MNANRNPIAVAVMVACLAIWTGILRHALPTLASGTLPMTGGISAPFGRPGGDSSTLRSAVVRKQQAAGIHHERADRMDAYPAAVR
jgi:hypothetical protein